MSQVRKRELKAAEKLMERHRQEDDLRQKQDVLRRMQEGPWTQADVQPGHGGAQGPGTSADGTVPKDVAPRDSKKNKKKGKKED